MKKMILVLSLIFLSGCSAFKIGKTTEPPFQVKPKISRINIKGFPFLEHYYAGRAQTVGTYYNFNGGAGMYSGNTTIMNFGDIGTMRTLIIARLKELDVAENVMTLEEAKKIAEATGVYASNSLIFDGVGNIFATTPWYSCLWDTFNGITLLGLFGSPMYYEREATTIINILDSKGNIIKTYNGKASAGIYSYLNAFKPVAERYALYLAYEDAIHKALKDWSDLLDKTFISE